MKKNNDKNKHTKMATTQSGFTFIEVVVTLAVVAITSGLAVPAFSDFISANRLATQSNTLVSALNYTRSEAVKRSQSVTITSNNNTSWEDGWTVTAADGTLLQQMDGLAQGSTLMASVAAVQYQARGTTNSAAAITFTLCIDAGDPGRQVGLSPIGRPTVDRHFICP